jgi:hypothetical protein
MSYEEGDTCMSYEEGDACTSVSLLMCHSVVPG